MSRTLKFDDPLLVLITDALRAGPGTPQWEEALTQVQRGGDEGDEFQILYTAREHLSAGREFREVRPGPQFTRKVLDAVQQSSQTSRHALPTATLFAFICVVVVIVVTLAIVKLMIPPSAPKPPNAEELSQLYFVNPQAQTHFDETSVGDWREFGKLPMQHYGDLHVGAVTATQKSIGGGIYYATPLAPADAFDLDATITAPKVSQNILAQVFVTDDPTFGSDSATTPHELVFMLKNGEASVILPDNTVAANATQIRPSDLPLEIRIKFNRDSAVIEAGAAKIFAGPHGLQPMKPRYAGVRLLARSPEEDSIRFSSVRILTPQKK